MAESTAATSMDFCTFVRELNQTPNIDFTTNGSSRNCCPAESRLSQEFENKMQQLLSNFDLNDQCDVPTKGISAIPANHCDSNSDRTDQSFGDSAFLVDKTKHDQSLETTLDNEDDPLYLTGDDDSEDAADGASSDEQQQSRSLSLSYSLSISHAQENASQYSQSTDKGLSKRYDSPCSYEDDRESECTNFDKLDDWNDFITDMQNNNNGDTNRDFREYYDEYQVAKCMKEKDDGADSADEYNVKAKLNTSHEMMSLERDTKHNFLEEEKGNRSTPFESLNTSAMNTSLSFWQYRNPPADSEDDPMTTEGSACADSGDTIQRVKSFKRKFRYDDLEDIEYEVSKVITEKFRKTDTVPFHGCHDPISSIDDELFARMVLIESSSKTPVPENNNTYELRNEDMSEYNKIANDNDTIESDSSIATTPTNVRNLDQVFQHFEDAPCESASQLVNNGIPLHRMLSQSAIDSSTSVFNHFDGAGALKAFKSE
ncbi:uncharacterized protein LOC134210909 [Armigeres subalbatus]|uniref:uncharacterized protein LOC134210909 n=1 Tax=Armigeres subalbatus TaxID=124917 RepID=UPI002ED5FF81